MTPQWKISRQEVRKSEGLLFYLESFSNTNNDTSHLRPLVIHGSNFLAMANHTIINSEMPDNGIHVMSDRETIGVPTVSPIP